MTESTPLSYEVLVSDGVRRATELHLPDGGPIVSSPLSSTLIYGQRDAVLVDPPFTREQTVRVGDWIERSGKRLAYVYSTHGHGDHWFGTAQLLERFPGATVYATEGTIRLMHQQATKGREQTWDKDFPGLIPESPVLAHPIPPEDSSWRATSSRRSRPSTPTPTTPRSCTCPPSASWSLAMSPTTGCTSTFSKRRRRNPGVAQGHQSGRGPQAAGRGRGPQE
jgi:hypothetical protein